MPISVISAPSKAWIPIVDWTSLLDATGLSVNINTTGFKQLLLRLLAQRKTAAVDGNDTINLSFNSGAFNGLYSYTNNFLNGAGTVSLGSNTVGNAIPLTANPRDPLSQTYFSFAEALIYLDVTNLGRYYFKTKDVTQYNTISPFRQTNENIGMINTTSILTSLQLTFVGGNALDADSKYIILGSKSP